MNTSQMPWEPEITNKEKELDRRSHAEAEAQAQNKVLLRRLNIRCNTRYYYIMAITILVAQYLFQHEVSIMKEDIERTNTSSQNVNCENNTCPKTNDVTVPGFSHHLMNAFSFMRGVNLSPDNDYTKGDNSAPDTTVSRTHYYIYNNVTIWPREQTISGVVNVLQPVDLFVITVVVWGLTKLTTMRMNSDTMMFAIVYLQVCLLAEIYLVWLWMKNFHMFKGSTVWMTVTLLLMLFRNCVHTYDNKTTQAMVKANTYR